METLEVDTILDCAPVDVAKEDCWSVVAVDGGPLVVVATLPVVELMLRPSPAAVEGNESVVV